MNLNIQQQEAIEYYGSPQVIIAGAGTGKTTVMIQKIKHLIETKKHRGASILALTFTNKAANEMKERFQLLSLDCGQPTFGTFHSFCLRFLKQTSFLSSTQLSSNFTIIDAQQQKELIAQLMKNVANPYNRKPKDYLSKISAIKQCPRLMHSELLDHSASDIQSIFHPYNEKLKELNCMDFDDLLLYTHDILTTQQSELIKCNERYEYVIVDEYQDTNQIQNEITILLSKDHQRVCVVGDFDQTIYSWRGAKVENLLQFNEHFPNCTTQKLEINYRSTHEILHSANQLIEHNRNRQPKKLISDRKGHSKPQHLVCFSEQEEANVIADKITALVDDGNYDDFAILYRTNQQARVIEEVLTSRNIPHRIVGTTPFYQRSEIKSAIAYLQCLKNINQPIWFERAMLQPARGIGKTSIHSLIQFSIDHQCSIEDALQHSDCPLQRRYIDIALTFVQQLKDIQKMPCSIEEKLTQCLDMVGFESYLKKQDNFLDRMDNIKELVSKLKNVNDLDEFLDEVTLFQGSDVVDSTKKVNCLTLHLAKGLEFSVVFIPGFEDDLLPLRNTDSIEEERRLAYVGITRGKTQVYLLSAYKRTLMGDDWYHNVSPFIKELNGTIDVYFTAQTDHLAKAMVFKYNEAGIDFNVVQQSSKTISATAVNMTAFSPGDVIVHPSLGTGTVESTSGEGDGLMYDIQFSAGRKKLMAKFAPIKSLS